MPMVPGGRPLSQNLSAAGLENQLLPHENCDRRGTLSGGVSPRFIAFHLAYRSQ